MHRLIFKTCFVFLIATAFNNANATLTFSNISYTNSSVTFTVDGNMIGYDTPAYRDSFSLSYGGDIWQGPNPVKPYPSNTWSRSVFDNVGIAAGDRIRHKPECNHDREVKGSYASTHSQRLSNKEFINSFCDILQKLTLQ